MLINDDCFNVFPKIKNNSIDLVFADPPYFLSNNGLSIHSGKIVSVNKGEWDKESVQGDMNDFNYRWLSQCFRVLKESGSIYVTGTKHNIFNVKENMEKIGFHIINIIIWHKVDPPPLIYKNKYRFSYEFIIFASKTKNYYFNFEYLKSISNKEMDDVWELPSVSIKEKKCGYHPTQKPLCLLDRIINASSKSNDIVLDPFLGSGTTAVSALKNKRRILGIEKDSKFYIISKKRISF